MKGITTKQTKSKCVTNLAALGFALGLTLGASQTAFGAWNPPVTSTAQLELEMESCGFLEDRSKIYTQCVQSQYPQNHKGTTARYYSRGTMCRILADHFAAPVWWRPDVARAAQDEISRTNCVEKAYQFTLNEIRNDAVGSYRAQVACGEGTVFDEATNLCVADTEALINELPWCPGLRSQPDTNGKNYHSASLDGGACKPRPDCYLMGLCGQDGKAGYYPSGDDTNKYANYSVAQAYEISTSCGEIANQARLCNGPDDIASCWATWGTLRYKSEVVCR